MAATAHWNCFIQRCLQTRVSPDKFVILFKALQKKIPLSAEKISKILIENHLRRSDDVDPLMTFYVGKLLSIGKLEGYDVLLSLNRRDTAKRKLSNEFHRSDFAGLQLVDFENAVLNVLFQDYTSGVRPRSGGELQKTMEALANRVSAVASEHAEEMMNPDVFRQIDQQELYLREALGILFIAILESSEVARLLDSALSHDQAKNVAQALSSFVSVLAENSVPLANRIDALRKSHKCLQLDLPASFADGTNDNLVVSRLELDGFMESMSIRSRAAMYVYLDVLLSERPMTNDASMVTYLQARYKNDTQSLVLDLILAAFDVLATTTIREASAMKTFLIRSFTVNKLPPLLQSLATMSFMPIEFEFSVQQAFSRSSASSFQSFPSDFTFGNQDAVLAEARQQFVYACALHGLISQASIVGLLNGQVLANVPISIKLQKDILVAEHASDSRKLEFLISAMEKLDGNAGIVADSLIEILHQLWASRDTITLKTFCNQLSRRHLALDAIFLFTNPSNLLFPLCQLIDNWKYDDDQGEYQPVYDEFSSCLSLVLVVYYRYNLTINDLGLVRDQSFVCRLLEGGAESQPIESFTPDQEKQFTGWIRGLFETEGISDDLMSACPPQDFYVLVPTIFEQSINACRHNYMAIDSLKNGLELLLETFLLPSLVPALQWLTKHSWEHTGDTDVIVQVLHKLTSPASLHGEGGPMHSTVLAIVGGSLTTLLQDLRRREPTKQDIEPLLAKLTPYADFHRAASSQHIEPQSWSPDRSAGVLKDLRQSISIMCFWSSPMALSPQLPTYTYKQLHLALQLAGASGVLEAVLEECKSQNEGGLGEYALDIATSLTCANWLHQNGRKTAMDLRTAISLAVQSKVDEAKRDLLIKLSRRVEAQLAGVQIAPANLQIVMADIMPDATVMEPVQHAAMSETILPAPMDFPMVDDMQMDLSALDEQGAFGHDFDSLLGAGNEDDIFDGLALDDDVDIS